MGYYKLFIEENNYCLLKEKALNFKRDGLARREAIHTLKTVYGSSIRKLLEVSGWHKGRVLNTIEIEEIFSDFTPEVIRFLNCIIDAYNDNRDYKNRQFKVKSGLRYLTLKKRFKAYRSQSIRELDSYKGLYSSESGKQKYREMKIALIIFNSLMHTFFIRHLPKKIPKWLYQECVSANDIFKDYYKLSGEEAVIQIKDKNITIYHRFGKEVAILLSLYFLHLRR